MRNLFRVNALWVTFALFVASSLPSLGWTAIYDNSVNDLQTRFDPGTLEVGDQIVLAPATPRSLIYFDFEYWGIGNTATTFAGNVQARVRFYVNDGPLFNGYATPGTQFYDSDWFGGFGATDQAPFRATLVFTEGTDFPAGGLAIPADEITWSVQFQGMVPGTDTVGVDLYSPPVSGLGQNYPDYWQKDGSGNWTLMQNTVPMSFGARLYVPEPSASVLALFAGLAILAGTNLLRRKD